MSLDGENLDVAKRHLRNFKNLLESIDNLDAKKRTLWLQIYENAVEDRQNAYNNYVQLVEICQAKSSEFAVHGRTLGTYLERMSKANDQLIRLAELVAKEQEKTETVSADDIFNKISRN